MPVSRSAPSLLSSRFAFRNPALLFARATLAHEHLSLTGWSWRGRYHRRIPLKRILQVDVPDHDGLLLWLSNGETVRLRIRRPQTWKRAIEASLATTEATVSTPSSQPADLS